MSKPQRKQAPTVMAVTLPPFAGQPRRTHSVAVSHVPTRAELLAAREPCFCPMPPRIDPDATHCTRCKGLLDDATIRKRLEHQRKFAANMALQIELALAEVEELEKRLSND